MTRVLPGCRGNAVKAPGRAVLSEQAVPGGRSVCHADSVGMAPIHHRLPVVVPSGRQELPLDPHTPGEGGEITAAGLSPHTKKTYFKYILTCISDV